MREKYFPGGFADKSREGEKKVKLKDVILTFLCSPKESHRAMIVVAQWDTGNGS
jgi:hypothetical protein